MINHNSSIRILMVLIAISSAFTGTAQDRSPMEDRVNVVVGKFYADENVEKRLEFDIPFLINRSLLNYKGLNLIEDSRFTTLVVYSKDYAQKRIKEDYEGLEYILFGNIVSIKEELTINTFLMNVKDNVTYDLKPVRGVSSSLFSICADIGKESAGRIFEMESGMGGQGITIAIISDIKVKKNPEAEYFTDILVRESIRNLEYFVELKDFKVLPFSASQKYKGMSLEDVATFVPANGILQIRVTERDDLVLVIHPVFYQKSNKNNKEFDQIIPLPSIPGNYYADYPLEDFVINELIGFVRSVVTEDGAWDLESLLFNSDSPEKYIEEGDTYLAVSDFFLSNYYYYKALNLTTDMELRVQLFYKLGVNKVDEYRLEEAREEFNKILLADPDNLLGIKGLGIVSLADGDLEDAYKKFDYIAKAEPGMEDIHMLLGTVLFEQKKWEEAISMLKKDQEINPWRNDVGINLGLSYLNLKDYDASIAEFRKLYDRDKFNKDHQFYLSYATAEKGISEFKAGNYAAAVELIYESYRYYRLAYTSNYLRLALIRLGKFDEADNLIESEILQKNYDATQIYFQHALDIRELFITDNNPQTGERLIENLRKSLDYRDDPMAYYYLGDTYTRLGMMEQGLENLYIAKEKAPANLEVHLELMNALLLGNNFNECVELYESLFFPKPDYRITERYRALMFYFLITALRLQDQDTAQYEIKLDRLLSDGVVVDEWSYDSYIAWLEAGEFDRNDKTYLLELTARMREAATSR